MNRRNLSVMFLPVLGALLVAPNASAQTVCETMHVGDPTVGDVMILSTQPTTNFDNFGQVSTGVAKGNHPGYTLMRMDLSAIPSSALVTSATVSLTENAGLGSDTVNVHNILGGWDPTTATWSDFSAGFDPTSIASYATAPGSASGLSFNVSFDITPISKQWVDGEITNNGILLEQAAGVSYYNAGTGTPIFTVCWVPLTCNTVQQNNGVGETAIMILKSSADTNWDSYAGFFTGYPKNNLEGRTLLRWDLSFIPSNATVRSSMVTLTENYALSANPVYAHQVFGGWDPLTVTWNDFSAGYNATPAASFTTVTNLSGALLPMSFNVTPLTQTWVNSSSTNHGVLLEETATHGRTYYNADPALHVCYYAP